MDKVELKNVAARLRELIKSCEGRFPDCWREIAKSRESRLSAGARWPGWCYAPLRIVEDAMCGGREMGPLELLRQSPLFGAVAAWRLTQGIYCFDRDLFEAVSQSDLNGNLPAELLTRMPEWSTYVHTPGHRLADGSLVSGFFAIVEHDLPSGRPELWLLVEVDRGGGHFDIRTHRVLLGEGTLLENIRASYALAHHEAAASGLGFLAAFLKLGAEALRVQEQVAADLTPLVCCLLYLCSANAEVRAAGDQAGTRRPQNPLPIVTRRGGARIFPPSGVTAWEVGYRFGAELRAAREVGQVQGAAARAHGTHASPRPHPRRGHFHSFWTGRRDDPGARRLLVKWLPPTRVNVTRSEDLVPTIRRVSSPRDDRRGGGVDINTPDAGSGL